MKTSKRIFFLVSIPIIIFLLVGVGIFILLTPTPRPKVETDIITYIKQNAKSDDWFFKLDEVTDFSWDYVVFFNGAANRVSNADISKIIGQEYKGSTYGSGMIFIRDGERVAEYFEPEKFDPPEGSLYSYGGAEPVFYVATPDEAYFWAEKGPGYYAIWPKFRLGYDDLIRLDMGMSMTEVSDIIGEPDESSDEIREEFSSNGYAEVHYSMGTIVVYTYCLEYTGMNWEEAKLTSMWLEKDGEFISDVP